MEVAARWADEGDAASLTGLREEAVKAARGERGGDMLVRSESASRPLAEAARVAVAEIDGSVIGYAEAAVQRLADGALICVVGAFYVEPGAREVGAGEALIDLVKAWATEVGAEAVDVVALPGSRETKNFFESSGFAARLIVMTRRL